MRTVEEFLAKPEEERDRTKRDIARKDDDLMADINLEIDQRRVSVLGVLGMKRPAMWQSCAGSPRRLRYQETTSVDEQCLADPLPHMALPGIIRMGMYVSGPMMPSRKTPSARS